MSHTTKPHEEKAPERKKMPHKSACHDQHGHTIKVGDTIIANEAQHIVTAIGNDGVSAKTLKEPVMGGDVMILHCVEGGAVENREKLVV